MAAIMILLRHGQSEFNLHFNATRQDPGIIDPTLTGLGRAQASEAARALSLMPIRRIISSPYTRTLQTAAPLARALGVPVSVNPIVRERYAFACDVGTPRTDLERTWPQLDFSSLEEVWWPAGEESARSIKTRAASFRAAVFALPNWSDTVVVTHWGFILCLTGQSVANGTWLRCDPAASPPSSIRWRA